MSKEHGVKKVKKVVKAEVPDEDTTIDREKVAKVKKLKKERKARESAPAPEKLIPTVNGVANPIVENRRLKRAMAVALATLVKEPSKLAGFVREAGIPFKQVQSREHYKNADLLAKNEWSGMPYAKWALQNGKSYRDLNEDKVAVCMKFAMALTGEKAPAGVKTEPDVKAKKSKKDKGEGEAEKTPVKKLKKLKKVKKVKKHHSEEESESEE